MAATLARTGVLLINLGTPEAPTPSAVRRYLREFLSDPRVIDLAPLGRWLLLNFVILPFRPHKSAEAYAKIWTSQGSPLLTHGLDLRNALREALGPQVHVELGMRYGGRSIPQALARMLAHNVNRVVVLPLFPQYSGAATGSAVQATLAALAREQNIPAVHVLGPFYDHPSFVAAEVAVARPVLAAFRPDFVVMSYHGLPERQLRRADRSGDHCLASTDCCSAIGPRNRACYRAQCYATSRALAQALGLSAHRHATSFQSRLGRTVWIRPYTDEVLTGLRARGLERLAVMSPAFVADCLETLEELGMRLRDQWLSLGGKDFVLVPSLNTHPRWVEAVAEILGAHVA
ncbi:MAG: ferrochelatase [Myxococcota bacterium]